MPSRASSGRTSSEASAGRRVIWHDLECGAYRADLALWLALAQQAPAGPILEVGAGTGRVALALAATGRNVLALDHDPRLLEALRERAGELEVQTLCADARRFTLPPDAHGPTPATGTNQPPRVALCLVPMQTVQLLGGPDGRLAFLRSVRAQLRAGGRLACAITGELEVFDRARGTELPTPERARIGGVLYTSQATRVALGARTVTIERERSSDDGAPVEHELIELDRLSVEQLQREGEALGLHAEPARQIPATADHAGSSVVVLRV